MPRVLSGMNNIITSDEFSPSSQTRIWREPITIACNVFSSEYLFFPSPFLCRQAFGSWRYKSTSTPFSFHFCLLWFRGLLAMMSNASHLLLCFMYHSKTFPRMARRWTPASLQTSAADNCKCLCVNWEIKRLNYWACTSVSGVVVTLPITHHWYYNYTQYVWCQRLYYKTLISCHVYWIMTEMVSQVTDSESSLKSKLDS